MPRRNWPHCRALSGIWQPQPLRLLLNQRISLYPRRSITAHRTTHNEPSSSALARTRPGMNQHESQDHPRPIDRFSPPPTYTLLAATSVLIFCAASNAPSLFPAADQPPTGNHVTGLLTHYTSKKKLKGDFGEIDLETPRDRNGSFEPRIVAKNLRSGMTTREIEGHLK